MSYKKLLIAKNTVKSCNPYSTIFLQSHIYSYSGRKWSKKPCSGNILYRHLWNEFKLDLKCNDKNRDHILVHSVRGILNGCMNNTIKRLQNHQGAASDLTCCQCLPLQDLLWACSLYFVHINAIFFTVEVLDSCLCMLALKLPYWW